MRYKKIGKVLGAFIVGLVIGGWSMHVGLASIPIAKAGTDMTTQSVVAFAKDLANGSQVLYLIDPGQKVISVYHLDSKTTKLKLATVRHYAADHLLSEFNNEPPNVADIEKLVTPR